MINIKEIDLNELIKEIKAGSFPVEALELGWEVHTLKRSPVRSGVSPSETARASSAIADDYQDVIVPIIKVKYST